MIELKVEAGLAAAASLTAIKALSWDNPGSEELTLVIATRTGERRLGLGPVWCYSGDEACMARLAEFGDPRFAGPWPRLRAELCAASAGPEEFVLFGSGVLLLAGLRESIGDLDLFVTPSLFERLASRGWQTIDPNPPDPPFIERWGLEEWPVHAFSAWTTRDPWVDELETLAAAEDRCGWPCAPLELVAKHKYGALAAAAELRVSPANFAKHQADLTAMAEAGVNVVPPAAA